MDISWSMNQDAEFKALAGKDGWGQPSYGAATPLRVRWQFKQKLVRARDGQEVMSEAEVWLPLSITPEADDVLTYRGEDYVILNAEDKVDIHGQSSHWKVYCKTLVA